MEGLSEPINVREASEPVDKCGGKKNDANSAGWHIIEFVPETSSGERLGVAFHDSVGERRWNPGHEDDGWEGVGKSKSLAGSHPAAWLERGNCGVARRVFGTVVVLMVRMGTARETRPRIKTFPLLF
jgi:hypothetical protein